MKIKPHTCEFICNLPGDDHLFCWLCGKGHPDNPTVEDFVFDEDGHLTCFSYPNCDIQSCSKEPYGHRD